MKKKVNSQAVPEKKRGFFKELKTEVKRITWPSKEDTTNALIAVTVVSLIYFVLVGGLDYIFSNLFKFIFNL